MSGSTTTCWVWFWVDLPRPMWGCRSLARVRVGRFCLPPPETSGRCSISWASCSASATRQRSNSLDDLRHYVRRLYALKVLLPRRAAELGLDEAEAVERGVGNTLREALIDRLRQVEVDERIELSQDDLLAYYERHRDRYVRSERITILEVLLETRQEAEEVLAEVEAGENLSELAGRYSVRSSRIRRAGGRIQLMRPDKYGRLGWAAKEAEIGEVVGPIKSTQGYSVFEVLKKEPGRQHSFEESRIRVAEHLRQERINAGAAALVERLNDKYSEGIQLFETHLQAAGDRLSLVPVA